MMTPKEVISHVFAEPFRPFRIRMASGEAYEIKHPENVSVGRSNVTLFVPSMDERPSDELFHKLSLLLMESIEPLGKPKRRTNHKKQ
jgi:hypothetical protein